MSATKTQKTLLTSQSLGAAASVNTTEWNLSTAYGGLAAVKITNGGSGPTTQPTVTFYVGDATGVKRQIYQVATPTTNSLATDVVFEIPPSAMFVNITIQNGATNAVTVEAYGQELTTI